MRKNSGIINAINALRLALSERPGEAMAVVTALDAAVTGIQGDRQVTLKYGRDIVLDIFGPAKEYDFKSEWKTAKVVDITGRMYDSRNFEDMPKLGEALKEAGCKDKVVLKHCEPGGVHVRGCWLVDVILDKK